MKKILTLFCLTLLVSGCSWNSQDNKQDNAQTPAFKTSEASLAQCLADKGVMAYGTSWCSHCQAQKEAFGEEAQKIIPFVDCETQQATCQKEGIQGYPTWKFSNGDKLPGKRDLKELAEKAGCEYTPSQSEAEARSQMYFQ